MDSRITVDPRALAMFHDSSAFYVISDGHTGAQFDLRAEGDLKADKLTVREGESLGDVLATVPDHASVLVIAPRLFVRGEDLAELRGRRVAVMPCGSTPVRTEHLRYFVDVLTRTDPAAQAGRAERFFQQVEEAETLWFTDDMSRTRCSFDPAGDEYEWNQQAGPIGPGEQQIAPAGELSVLPMDISGFDPARSLALNGELTLRGEPIVHAGYDPALEPEQADLYTRLSLLRRHPVVLEVRGGRIMACRAGTATPEGARVAATLNDLFAADDRYATLWELGFGINTAMNIVPANCGLNEVYGGTDGVVHWGVGLTPFTRFALTFICPGTTVTDQDGTVVLGAAEAEKARPRHRIRRTREAGCGCHA